LDRLDHKRAAIVSQPDDPVPYLMAHIADPAREASLLRRALSLRSDYAPAHFVLSVRHMERSEEEAALLELRRAIVLAPQTGAANSNLAMIAETNSDFTDAVPPARRAMLIDPQEALFQANLGSILAKTDQAAAALSRYRAAIALDPSQYKIWLDHGITLAEFGRREPARAAFLRANRLAPRAVRPVRLCIELERVTPTSQVFGVLSRLAGAQHRLPAADRSELAFALAKSFDDLGDAPRAFAAMQAANKLRHGLAPYDEAAALGRLRTIAELFTAPAIRAAQAHGAPGDRPVFIVGMPRCGSTLVEQVLAGHPEIATTGESKTLPKLMKRHGPASFHAVGAAYMAGLADIHPSARRVTDKLLGNFTRLGFIASALPGARIIHMRRDPLDCCLSIHSRHFLEGHPYASDLGELGRYYRAYTELMAHWRAALPAGMMIELSYEQVVEDLPGQAGILLDFLGLPWNDRCLDFHKTERMVRTASQSQVRMPLTRRGIGRWRPYIPHVAPLIDALGPLADQGYKSGA